MTKWFFKAATAAILTATLQAETTLHSSIPVVDMAEYFQEETKQKFIDELASAFREVGFVGVINTGADPQVLDRAYAAAKTFFKFDTDLKMGISARKTNFQRGYVPDERAAGSPVGDFKEFLHIGKEFSEEQYARTGYPHNLWPDSFDLKNPLVDLLNLLDECSIPLEEAMSLAMGQSADFLRSMSVEGESLLRSAHYPANPPEGVYWAAPHTDIDLYTILPRASAPGLQVKNRDGEWIDVIVPDGAFIVNCGDMLRNLTNGDFKSAFHQVVSQGKEERFSMVYFVHARAKDDLSPLPQFIEKANGVRHYPECTREGLLSDRLIDIGLADEPMIERYSKMGLCEKMIPLGLASTRVMKMLRDRGYASDEVLAELERLGE